VRHVAYEIRWDCGLAYHVRLDGATYILGRVLSQILVFDEFQGFLQSWYLITHDNMDDSYCKTSSPSRHDFDQHSDHNFLLLLLVVTSLRWLSIRICGARST
jgi:hypothetical protein